MRILIKNGHIIDPSQKIDEVGDILIEDGKIKEIKMQSKEQKAKSKKDSPPTHPSPSRGEGKGEGESLLSESRIINAEEMVVLPGLIDMHVHLREPGFEY